MILIDKGCPISLLDQQLYYSLSLVTGTHTVFNFNFNLLLHWVKHSYPLLSATTYFECNLFWREISFSLWYLESIFYRHLVELSVFQLTSYNSLTSLLNPPSYLSTLITSTTHTHHPCTCPTHTTHTHTYNPYSRITVHPDQPYHIINNETETIPARTNTITTIFCAFLHSEITYWSHQSNIFSTNQCNTHL